MPGWSSSVERRSTSTASSSWQNWMRGSKPSTVGTTGSEKYRVSGVSMRGPTKLVNRRIVNATSGRRRPNPRTYPSTSTESFA